MRSRLQNGITLLSNIINEIEAPIVPFASNDARFISFGTAQLLGVTRRVSETYLVGSFEYTNLGEAVAQARRMIKLEGDCL